MLRVRAPQQGFRRLEPDAARGSECRLPRPLQINRSEIAILVERATDPFTVAATRAFEHDRSRPARPAVVRHTGHRPDSPVAQLAPEDREPSAPGRRQMWMP